MAKNKRGRGIKNIANWRGTCKSCSRTGVKLLWEKADAAGTKMKVCKACGS